MGNILTGENIKIGRDYKILPNKPFKIYTPAYSIPFGS
jgi:hypothetical protein